MKFKILSKEQILISLDRLTRFKNTRDKYARVFTDILLNNLIDPKIRKCDIEKMDNIQLTKIAVEILNSSLERYVFTKSENNKTNLILRDYENSVYVNDTAVQHFLNNNINYFAAAKLITDDSVINLKWLKKLVEYNDCAISDLREKYCLKFPIEKILLAEGITEEILIPAFSRFLGFDFYQKGIQIIAAGGKNQVVKMYYKLIEEVKIPIFILLDKDAEDNIKQITPKLRSIDKIHLVSCGEFEDLLSKSLIVKTVNNHFENFMSINETDLPADLPTAKVLEELFKTKGLHEFKKAEFAKLVRENITQQSDVSDEIINIINELMN